jgi:hypothetical protein
MHRGPWRNGLALLETAAVLGVVALAVFIAGATSASLVRVGTEERVCRAHLRQLGRALMLYRDQWGELPPRLALLYPRYVQDRRVFECSGALRYFEDQSGNGAAQTWLSQMFNKYEYHFEYVAERSQSPWRERDLSAKSLYMTWAQARALRGSSLPVISCSYHDPHLYDREKSQKTPITKLVLRLDGKVSRSVMRPDRQRDGNLLWYEY